MPCGHPGGWQVSASPSSWLAGGCSAGCLLSEAETSPASKARVRPALGFSSTAASQILQTLLQLGGAFLHGHGLALPAGSRAGGCSRDPSGAVSSHWSPAHQLLSPARGPFHSLLARHGLMAPRPWRCQSWAKALAELRSAVLSFPPPRSSGGFPRQRHFPHTFCKSYLTRKLCSNRSPSYRLPSRLSDLFLQIPPRAGQQRYAPAQAFPTQRDHFTSSASRHRSRRVFLAKWRLKETLRAAGKAMGCGGCHGAAPSPSALGSSWLASRPAALLLGSCGLG